MTFAGTLAATNVPVLLALTNFSAGASGFVGETDKGGAVDNKGGIITPTGNAIPVVTAPAQYTIPLRTPFALTGSATDADGDSLLYSWEQNDRGGAAGTSLLNNTKTNGPLFAMFPKSGQISRRDTLLYDSPGENHLTDDPDAGVPGPAADPRQQHERRHGRLPDRRRSRRRCRRRSRSASRSSCRPRDYVGFAGIEREPALAALPLHRPRRQGRRQQRRHDAAARHRRGPVPRHLAEHGGVVHGRLDADGDLGRRRTRTSRRSARRT